MVRPERCSRCRRLVPSKVPGTDTIFPFARRWFTLANGPLAGCSVTSVPETIRIPGCVSVGGPFPSAHNCVGDAGDWTEARDATWRATHREGKGPAYLGRAEEWDSQTRARGWRWSQPPLVWNGGMEAKVRQPRIRRGSTGCVRTDARDVSPTQSKHGRQSGAVQSSPVGRWIRGLIAMECFALGSEPDQKLIQACRVGFVTDDT